ncbi:hypothetical protein X975_22295, partial [Stegodyphus mimosarum]
MHWGSFIFYCLVLLTTSLVASKSLNRAERDIQDMANVAATGRQLGSGLSALGTLVSPLLFLMGMGSFISMLPQMFQTVLSGVGSNLIQSFTGAASSGGSSTRLKRDLMNENDILKEVENRLNLAVMKYERPINA